MKCGVVSAGGPQQAAVLELQAEGEKKAFVLRGEGEAARLSSLDTATINPRTLAVSSSAPSKTSRRPPGPRWSCPTRPPA
jgi:hypothetical protein